MTLRSRDHFPIPEETARVARAVFRKGNPYLLLRDELGMLYQDSQFDDLFARAGRTAYSPARLTLVTILQFMEGLTDRQAADAVRSRIDWKYFLGLPLTDAGFDSSVLTEFRQRLLVEGAEAHLLGQLLTVCQARGWLKARGQQRLDSTRVVGLLRSLNRLELVRETLRHALDELATVAPGWLAGWVPLDWFQQYGAPRDSRKLPTAQAARQALAEQIGADGYRLLTQLYDDPTRTVLTGLAAVQALRQIWVQQYQLVDGVVRWRDAENLPPGEKSLQSPFEVEARYSHHGGQGWTGYTVHLTESCDPDTPHLITDVATTGAAEPDRGQATAVIARLATRGLLPAPLLADGGYLSAGELVASQTPYQVDLVGPLPPDTSWQARSDGYTLEQFVVDWAAHQVTCPQGQRSRVWSPSQNSRGKPVIHVQFARQVCAPCSERRRCTQATRQGRPLKLTNQAEHEALRAGRAREKTVTFQQTYQRRAGVEGTISQGVRAFGLRQARYRGLAKTIASEYPSEPDRTMQQDGHGN